MSDQENQPGRAGMLIVGVVLLVAGLSFIGDLGWERLVPALGPIRNVLVELQRWTPGVALVVLGIMFVVFGSRGGVSLHRPATGTKLYRSRRSKMVAGVLGGLGEYFSIDPTLLRLAFVALVLLTNGPFVIAYIVMAIVVPQAPELAASAPSVPMTPPAPPAPPQG